MKIQSKEEVFMELYHGSDGYAISKSARKNNPEPTLVYGEAVFETFTAALSIIQPTEDDIFYDLGSGNGKAVFIAAISYNVQRSHGVELLDPLYQESMRIWRKADKDLQKKVSFEKNDFLKVDVSPATIVYINATGFFGEAWDNVVNHLCEQLRPQTRLIIITKSLPETHFKKLKSTQAEMSWGVSTINVFEKL